MKREGIFISYARTDGAPTAAELRQQLEGKFKVWQDLTRITGEREWWLQITEALNEVAFMLLVLTPGSIASNIVRKEWRYARQQGVCVYLVKGAADLDLGKLPRWMRDQHIYNWFDQQQRDKLFADLNKTPDLKRVPFMAEDLPADFVQRPGEFDELIRLLLGETREDPVAITAALRGAGGYGKTTLAKAVCHDERIQDAFDDGILWVTLGETPGDLTGRVEDLIYTLSGHRPGFTGVDAATARLVELLADRDILLVIDDVWNSAHLRPFVQGGDCCARLITTRNSDTLPINTQPVKVDAMKQSEAVKLLSVGLRGDQDLNNAYQSLDTLAVRLGEWPLMLKLANGSISERVEIGDNLLGAIEFVNEDLTENGLTAFDEKDPQKAVAATLKTSLKQLSDEDRQRYDELAVFPEDVNVPLVTIEKLWAKTSGFGRVKTEKLLTRLYKLSLLLNFDLSSRTIRLHDVIRAFLRDERKNELAALNCQLLDAHRPSDGWGALPPSLENEPYFWDHLAGHLVEAGRGEESVATVKDWRYLAKKTLLRKSPSVEKDLLQALPFAPESDPLRTLLRGYSMSSHLFNRCESLSDVEATLYCRMQHLTELSLAVEELAQNWESARIVSDKPLPDLPQPALLRTLEGHSASVWSCVFSPDGKLIVSASHDRTLKVWETSTGQTLQTLKGHSASVWNCAFSPDGKLVVSASSDLTLKVWDVLTGQTLHTLEGHSALVNNCAFSPDGKLIVSASFDRTLKVWDVLTGQPLCTFEGHSAWVNGCAFSPDGKLIVSASSDQTLKVWKALTGQVLRTLKGHSAPILGCAFSADGKLIVSASSDQTLKVWEASTGEVLHTLKGHSALVNDCAFSPDGNLIVSASDDLTLKVWEASTGEALRNLEGHSARIKSCAFSPDGKLIASASDDLTIKIWNVMTEQILLTSAPVLDCSFSSDGKLIVSASMDQTLTVWDVMAGQVIHILKGHSASVWSCAFSSNGKLIVSASNDETLKIWDALTGQPLRTLVGHSARIRSCAFSPDDKLIVSTSVDETLKIWDALTGQTLSTLEGHPDWVKTNWVRSCAFSPDGKLIISTSDYNTIKVWNTMTGQPMHTLEGHSDSVLGCIFSPDGNLIVSASSDQALKIWDANTGQALRTLEGHSNWVQGCAFSPDGKLIVSASSDQTLKVWDSATGNCLATFYADGAMYACAMHGELIVAGGKRGVYFLKLVR